MKKLLLLSLILAVSAVNLSAASTSVTAKINVIDPATDASINVSSSSATFGNILVAKGKYTLLEKVGLTVEGTQTKKVTVEIPTELKLTTGTGTTKLSEIIAKISVEPTTGHFAAATVADKKSSFVSTTTMDAATTKPLTAKIDASLDLLGTEAAGDYSGILTLTAKYNK